MFVVDHPNVCHAAHGAAWAGSSRGARRGARDGAERAIKVHGKKGVGAHAGGPGNSVERAGDLRGSYFLQIYLYIYTKYYTTSM